jgi:hypothetical protein
MLTDHRNPATEELPAPEPAVPPIFFDESVCGECGWTYTGTYCEVCTPCDDCGQIPALCWCESDSTDPFDD